MQFLNVTEGSVQIWARLYCHDHLCLAIVIHLFLILHGYGQTQPYNYSGNLFRIQFVECLLCRPCSMVIWRVWYIALPIMCTTSLELLNRAL